MAKGYLTGQTGGKKLDIFNFPLSIQMTEPTPEAVGHLWIALDDERASQITNIVVDDTIRLNYTDGTLIIQPQSMNNSFLSASLKKKTNLEYFPMDVVQKAETTGSSLPWQSSLTDNFSTQHFYPKISLLLNGGIDYLDAYAWNGTEWVVVSNSLKFLYGASNWGYSTYTLISDELSCNFTYPTDKNISTIYMKMKSDLKYMFVFYSEYGGGPYLKLYKLSGSVVELQSWFSVNATVKGHSEQDGYNLICAINDDFTKIVYVSDKTTSNFTTEIISLDLENETYTQNTVTTTLSNIDCWFFSPNADAMVVTTYNLDSKAKSARYYNITSTTVDYVGNPTISSNGNNTYWNFSNDKNKFFGGTKDGSKAGTRTFYVYDPDLNTFNSIFSTSTSTDPIKYISPGGTFCYGYDKTGNKLNVRFYVDGVLGDMLTMQTHTVSNTNMKISTAVSNNDRYLATCCNYSSSGGYLRVFDLTNRDLNTYWEIPFYFVINKAYTNGYSLAISDDGEYVIVSGKQISSDEYSTYLYKRKSSTEYELILKDQTLYNSLNQYVKFSF